jgi:mono/diheme cytochrome c family protein
MPHNVPITSQAGECRMRWSVGVTVLVLAAGVEVAAAQPFPAAETLSAQQIRGRDLFNQSCLVCHVKLQITSPAKYGPDLSQKAMGGQEAGIREVITNGTPNMPAFKYHFEADQIDAIVSYVKMLPAPPAKPNPPR